MANKANGSLCTNSKRPFIKPRQQNQELISASALDLCKPFDKPKLYVYRYEPFRRNGKKKLQFSGLHILAILDFLEEFCVAVVIQKLVTHFITNITSTTYI